MSTPIKSGQKVPIYAQDSSDDLRNDLVIQASVLNTDNGAVLFGPVVVPPIGVDGLYVLSPASSYTMQNSVQRITVRQKVFESDGTTPLKVGHILIREFHIPEEVTVTTTSNRIDILGRIEPEPQIVGTIECEKLKGNIENASISGTIADESVSGTISKPSIEGEVST